MLTLISATPGSGKTLYAVQLIYEALAKGHVVYSNILGLNVPGVLKIDTSADWRDLDHFKVSQPHLSHLPISVFLDEAHEHQGLCDKTLCTITDKAQLESIRDVGRSLSLHRHFGFDIYLITQHPRKLAGHVLGDVGRHLYLRRVFAMYRSTIYEWPEAHATITKSTRDDAVNKTLWRFPKHLYGTYISTEVDTHKSALPTKYKVIMAAPILAICGYLPYSLLTNNSIFRTNKSSSPSADVHNNHISTTGDIKPVSSDPTTIDCRDSNNFQKQQCIDFYKKVDSGRVSFATAPDGSMVVSNYNPSDPYAYQPTAVSYTPTRMPVFKGCLKAQGGDYYAYDQDYNEIAGVSAATCERFFAGGAFDYGFGSSGRTDRPSTAKSETAAQDEQPKI